MGIGVVCCLASWLMLINLIHRKFFELSHLSLNGGVAEGGELENICIIWGSSFSGRGWWARMIKSGASNCGVKRTEHAAER